MRNLRVVSALVALSFVVGLAGMNSGGSRAGLLAVSNDARKSLPFASVLKTKSKVSPAVGKVVFHIDLQEAIPSIGANNSYELGFTGKGTYVAVIDTGVEADHPFLAGKVALEACFSSECPNGQTEMYGPGSATSVHWHGTHVAGIIAGENQDFHGIAPDTKIIAINIFDKSGGAFDENIAKALAYVGSLAGDYNIAAVNMSLGGNHIYTEPCDTYLPAVTAEIHQLRMKNIVTVIAAGNNFSNGMSSPACISEAVSVAATYKARNQVTNFSNVSVFTTLSAPGYAITSSKLSGSYGVASGTSMAAPFVAGAFAVYRSKYGVQSVEDVVAAFQSTAEQGVDESYGTITKRLNLRSLFELPTLSTTSQAPLPSTSVVQELSSSSSSTTVQDSAHTVEVPATRTVEITTSNPILTNINPIGLTSSTTTSTSIVGTSLPIIRSLPTIQKKSMQEVAESAKVKLDGSVKTVMRVLPISARFCKVVGVNLVGLKTGKCLVTITMTRPNGKAVTKLATLFIA